jgi:hypothetical protein
LDNIFGVGEVCDPLPREKHERSAMTIEPDLPFVGCHAPPRATGAPICSKDAADYDFCLIGNRIAPHFCKGCFFYLSKDNCSEVAGESRFANANPT